MTEKSKVLTVSELNARVRGTLEAGFEGIWVAGEISNLTVARSGHVYLTLKDKKAEVSAVMWRASAGRLRFEPTDGLEVIVFGDVTLYEVRGRYQIVIRKMEPKGVGALQLAFRQLVEKLRKEGLFDEKHKQPLPDFPEHIGIVTSPTGAALRDILRVLERRWPALRATLFPVPVQGAAAGKEIATAIETMNRMGGFDVLIVGRGGGSIEDLWAFNEEVVARAIFASAIPVVSAVGHEVDLTISDMVADARALTPTAAAEMVTPDVEQVLEQLNGLARRLVRALGSRATLARAELRSLAERLNSRVLVRELQQLAQRADDVFAETLRVVERALVEARMRLEKLGGKLETLSPLAVLKRGYSITTRIDSDRPLKDAAEVKAGDRIKTRLANGEVESRVISEKLKVIS